MTAAIDSLTSATLKDLRERWWDDNFTEFLAETLRPRPGNRILDVGCGEGLGEVSIGRLHISQVRLIGIDLVLSKSWRHGRPRNRTISGHRMPRRMRAACRFSTHRSTRFIPSLFCSTWRMWIRRLPNSPGDAGEWRVVAVSLITAPATRSARFRRASVPSRSHAVFCGRRLGAR